MIHHHEDFSSWIINLQTKSLKSSGKETQPRNHRQAMLLEKRHSRIEPKKLVKEKRPFWSKYIEQSFWLYMPWVSFPGVAFLSGLANEDFTWQSYCSIQEILLSYRTNAHRLFLVKVEQITASFQNPTKVTVLPRRTLEAFYFVNLKVAKAVEFHETRRIYFFQQQGKCRKCSLLTTWASGWLTVPFLSEDMVTGITCDLGKNGKKQHLQLFCNSVKKKTPKIAS